MKDAKVRKMSCLLSRHRKCIQLQKKQHVSHQGQLRQLRQEHVHVLPHTVYENHNSLGREQPLGLDIKQSPNAQDALRPIPGLISCTGVTGSVGITRHAHATHVHVQCT